MPGMWGGGSVLVSSLSVIAVVVNDVTVQQSIGTDLLNYQLQVVYGTGQFTEYYVTNHNGAVVSLLPPVDGNISTDSLVSFRYIHYITPSVTPPSLDFDTIVDRGTSTNTDIILTWTTPTIPPSMNIASYTIEYQEIASNATTVDWINPTAIVVNFPAESKTFGSAASGSVLVVGTRYAFRIRSTSSSGAHSIWSTLFFAGFYGAVATAPQSITLTPASNQITVSFTSSANEATVPGGHLIINYIIQRGGVQIHSIDRGQAYSYVDTAASDPTVTYTYKIIPVNNMYLTTNGGAGYGASIQASGSPSGVGPSPYPQSPDNTYCVGTLTDLQNVIFSLNTGLILPDPTIHIEAGTYPLKIELKKGVTLDTRCGGKAAAKVYLTRGVEIYANGSHIAIYNICIKNDAGNLLTCIREVGDTFSILSMANCILDGESTVLPGVTLNGGTRRNRLYNCTFTRINNDVVFETSADFLNSANFSLNRTKSVRLNKCKINGCTGDFVIRGSASLRYGGTNRTATLEEVFITNCVFSDGKGIKFITCENVQVQNSSFVDIEKIYYTNSIEGRGVFNCDNNTFTNCSYGVQIDSIDVEGARGQFISSYIPIFTFNGNKIGNMNTAVVAMDSANAYNSLTVVGQITNIGAGNYYTIGNIPVPIANQYRDRYCEISRTGSIGIIENNNVASNFQITQWTNDAPVEGDEISIFSLTQITPASGIGRGWGSNAYANYNNQQVDCMFNRNLTNWSYIRFHPLVDYGTPGNTANISIYFWVRCTGCIGTIYYGMEWAATFKNL